MHYISSNAYARELGINKSRVENILRYCCSKCRCTPLPFSLSLSPLLWATAMLKSELFSLYLKCRERNFRCTYTFNSVIITIFYGNSHQMRQRDGCTHPFICIYSSLLRCRDCRHCTRLSQRAFFTLPFRVIFRFACTQPFHSLFFLSLSLVWFHFGSISCEVTRILFLSHSQSLMLAHNNEGWSLFFFRMSHTRTVFKMKFFIWID